MELEVLRKKLSSFKGEDGRIRGVSDDLLLEVLAAWETYGGTARDFYKSIGSSRNGIASILGKAKRLKREGAVMPFQEMAVEGITTTDNPGPITCDIEVCDQNKIIRFRKVDSLIEYLKKVA
ncbi:MAG: hypothetical protein U0T83_11260 [Bacteriovoracaceae bacterium]